MEIIPALLEKTADDLVKKLQDFSPYFSHFQIDIADGQFVPNNTIQIETITKLFMEKRIATNKNVFDFHLMVDHYQSDIDKLKKLMELITIHTVFIHLSSFEKSKLPLVDISFHLGIVLNPEDKVSTHWKVIQTFSAVQIMSVHPGFQGAPFLPKTLEKITHLRQYGFKGTIYVDGGINDKTLPLIASNKYYPDMLCVGSYLKTDPANRLFLLQQLIASTTTLKEKDF